MVDLNQLALFVRVVQAGSFAEAARRMAMPPTTLSRQVAQLEDALQLRLLQRSTRKLSLTDAGRTLFDRCAPQIDDLRAAANELSGEDQLPKGNVRIAAPASFFDFFSIDWVREFLQRYPAVQLEFVLSDGMADFIGEGIDVAFRGGGELADSSLVARKLTTTYLSLAASPDYLAARGTPQAVADLASHDCIRAIGPAGGTTTWRLNGPSGPLQVAVSGPFSANTSQAQLKAAIAGLGICLAPIRTLQPRFRTGELVEVLPGVATAPGGLYAVFPSRRHLPRAVTAFVDRVAEYIQAQSAAQP